MIKGIITEDYTALLPLTLRGKSGTEVNLLVTFDTGFDDYLTLPPELIAELEFPDIAPAEGVLADGSPFASRYYAATILWEGKPRVMLAIASEGKPLAGMLFVKGCNVVFKAEPGATIFISEPTS